MAVRNTFKYEVTWGDLDPVGHLRGSVYMDLAISAQSEGIDQIGYSTADMTEVGFAPIVLRSESRFYNEVKFGDTVTDTVRLAGLSSDASRWKAKHEFARSDGKKVATLRLEGTWIDLESRKPTEPPENLAAGFADLPRTLNFEELRSLVR